jgi:hypothetical protein
MDAQFSAIIDDTEPARPGLIGRAPQALDFEQETGFGPGLKANSFAALFRGIMPLLPPE